MTTREECDNQLLDESILTDDLFLDICLDLYECVVDMSESRVHRWAINIQTGYQNLHFLQKIKIPRLGEIDSWFLVFCFILSDPLLESICSDRSSRFSYETMCLEDCLNRIFHTRWIAECTRVCSLDITET